LTGVTPGTRIRYERITRSKWQAQFGSLPLVSIEREAIRQQVNMLSQCYADKTGRNAHGLLAGMLTGRFSTDTSQLSVQRSSARPPHRARDTGPTVSHPSGLRSADSRDT
jgi:hypothetical protein